MARRLPGWTYSPDALKREMGVNGGHQQAITGSAKSTRYRHVCSLRRYQVSGQRLAGVLWLIAGISSGGIAFFLVDPLDLAIFIGGAVLAILLGLAILARPSPPWVLASRVLGFAWLVAFGAVTITNLSLPIEEILSIVWVLAFGVAAAVVAYLRR